jgi:2-(1,2-epoxy-1,2-dihydrophenyl)acetyl-CoA isomerase
MLPTPTTPVPALTALAYAVDDGVATITLNRPDRRNSMTVQMSQEMHALLRHVAAAPDVRVVVLTGAGGTANSFCPGADLVAMSSDEADAERRQHEESDLAEYGVPLLLHEMAAVTVAALNGSAAGAGLGWACACDVRVAAASARFNTAFLDRAVAGDMALPWTLPRILGAAKARELCLFPDKFDAAEALRIGLVTKVFDAADFESGVAALVDRLRKASRPALRTLKSNFVAAERMGLEDYIDHETMRHAKILATESAQAGLRNFLSDRTPPGN